MTPKYSNFICRKTAVYGVFLPMLLSIAIACGRKKHKDDAAPPPAQGENALVEKPMDAETKKWWIARANMTLRLGQPLKDVGAAEDLQKLELKDITAKLTADPAFYDMMADFAGYWLGTKSGAIHETNEEYTNDENGQLIIKKTPIINPALADQPQVINAVKTMAKGGDFFSGLFQETGTAYLKSIERPYLRGPEGQKTPKEVRLAIKEKIIPEWTAFIQLLKEGKHDEFCAGWKTRTYFNLGGPNRSDFIFAEDTLDFRSFGYGIEEKCQQTNLSTRSDADKFFEAQITQKLEKLEPVITFLDKFEEQYGTNHPLNVDHVTDLIPLDLSEVGISKDVALYTPNFYFKLQNSSTNRNRRRASWVLKRFFCDDLTPINIEAPSSHVDGPHGSEAACQSCHYKLDPMAGYFRELGFFGTSFANMPDIFFDDMATAKRDVYEQPWKANASTGREWNIGYIRSLTNDKENTFGSNFKDLMELLKTAPEVKECFVRRVFEYSVGEEQAYDKAWGRSLVNRMNETAKTDPNLAIKQVFADVVTSKAYTMREKNNNTCYDFTSDTKVDQRAPCRIAAILERNCTSCHNTNSRQGGLDLSSWKIQSDQKPGFPHKRGEKDINSQDTFQDMADRLNATDPSLRMPLMKTMPAAEREELYLWLQKEITKK